MHSEIPAVQEPAYQFTEPGTLLFINGAPLSGKSTVAPLLAANISGCTTQNMDLFRLASQELDSLLPEAEREPTLQYGSCDGYLAIGDGSYSPQALVEGYNRYAAATCRLLHGIIPGLEAQGASDVLFEGVQLLPSVIGKYLNSKHKLIVITSDEATLTEHRQRLFGAEPGELAERYSTDKLLLIQQEITRQADALPADQRYYADNTGNAVTTASNILGFLANSGTIQRAAAA